MPVIRPIAIYLPQFHPIPENDEWWGRGFTEWTNVAKAKPLFEGHHQPHLPADLGFYDLRLEAVRIAQAEMAKANGIHGFCYYHYWFNGKRLLERPLNDVLKTGKPDFPFCVCWANENWSRRWDGNDHQVLIKQEYNESDDEAHMRYLCTLFSDERYIRVDDKPVFVVYKTGLLPDINRTAETWRRVAREEGIGEIYLCRMESWVPGDDGKIIDPTSLGFDASIEFFPSRKVHPTRIWGSLSSRILNKLKIKTSPFLKNLIYDYGSLVEEAKKVKPATYKLYPGIIPGWDNSARRKEWAMIMHHASPKLYKNWLQHIVQHFQPYSRQENFIFINAWNEWAEGNHLEPCSRWGNAYLQATKEVLDQHDSATYTPKKTENELELSSVK